MLSVRELHRIAASLDAQKLEQQLGPFVLLERPPDAQTQQKALQLGAQRTVAVKRPPTANDVISLLLQIDDLMVATLPPLDAESRIVVGRLPDCDLVVDDPSVSKHHANLTWDAAHRRVMVEDLGSSNGTWLNDERLHVVMAVRDGDTLAFGDAQFCFLSTATLYSRLTTGRFRGV